MLASQPGHCLHARDGRWSTQNFGGAEIKYLCVVGKSTEGIIFPCAGVFWWYSTHRTGFNSLSFWKDGRAVSQASNQRKKFKGGGVGVGVCVCQQLPTAGTTTRKKMACDVYHDERIGLLLAIWFNVIGKAPTVEQLKRTLKWRFPLLRISAELLKVLFQASIKSDYMGLHASPTAGTLPT